MRHEKEESGEWFEYICASNAIQTCWCIHEIHCETPRKFLTFTLFFSLSENAYSERNVDRLAR